MANAMLQRHLGVTTQKDNAVRESSPFEEIPQWKISAARLQREALIIWCILRNQKTPWYARIIAGAAAAYLLSPIQVIPSFIPFIGLMDDLVVLSVSMGLIRILTPRSVIHEARRRALVVLGQGENILPSAVRKITLAFALSWLVLSLGLFLILWRK